MAAKAEWVGAGVPLYNIDAATAKGGTAPNGITPLARDIFTSDDFYVDRDLWRDPRYFRCNSTLALDSQWGDYSSGPKYIKDDPATGAWGHCDVDYSRENIVSPYPFTTARAHSFTAHAGISATARPAALSPGARSRSAMVGDALSARGLHALVVGPRRSKLARRDGDADARTVFWRLR